MWFNDRPILIRSQGNRRKRRRVRTIRLGARLRSRGRPQVTRVAVTVVAIAAAVGVCALLWFGTRLLGDVLFSGNGKFVIRNIDIRGGVMISEALIREYTQVEEGMNLFSVDIKQIRSDFLRRAPSVKSMEISRILPDVLRIQITERMPLARVGWRGPLVVDRQGVVFVFKGHSSHLPVISGYRGAGLRPGSRLQGFALAALEVLDAGEDHPSLGLEIEAIEVDNREHLTLRLANRKAVKLAWREMGTMVKASRENLLKKLGRTSRALQSDKGRRCSTLDATMDEPIIGR